MVMARISKEELNRQRFLFPLEAVGAPDEKLAKKYSDDFFLCNTY